MPKVEWMVNYEFAESHRIKSYREKHAEEFDACVANLARVMEALADFGKPGAFHLGFFRSEGGNVWRIGQTRVKHACETRLYVYLYVKGLMVYVLTVGDKSQQRKDILRCKNLAKAIGERDGNEGEKR